jgi:hypothetical protein
MDTYTNVTSIVNRAGAPEKSGLKEESNEGVAGKKAVSSSMIRFGQVGPEVLADDDDVIIVIAPQNGMLYP